MNGARQPRLGVDIGRVIIDGSSHPDGGDTGFFQGDEATMLATPEMADGVPVITRLTELFAGRVWLVSTCGPTVQAKTLRWLEAHNFYLRTGVEPAAVRFCRARADKREHCTDLALTHFIDDHPEVHALIRGTVDYQYFFGPQPAGVPGYGIHAPTWTDVERLIRPTLGRASEDGLRPRLRDYRCHNDLELFDLLRYTSSRSSNAGFPPRGL